MRYTAEHKAQTRARLIQMGGAVAKKNGFATTGVDRLMESVGLTGGAFYSHFSSKWGLLRAIIERELALSHDLLTSGDETPLDAWIGEMLDRYLNYNHVKHPETGCPLPALSVEVARSDRSVKRVYEDRITQMQRNLAKRLGNDGAWTAIAQCVGAITIARAMASEQSGRKVLDANKRSLKRSLRKPAKRI